MVFAKAAMQKFTTKIVNMMKAERLYQTQGGPIILSQVVQVLCSTSQFFFVFHVYCFSTLVNKLRDFLFVLG